MNRVHAAVIKYIRDAVATTGGKTAAHFLSLSDEEIVRMMFSNYRGREKNARGLRLTHIGLMLMKEYFKAYEIALPADHKIGNRELLYLDKRATLPYYLSSDKLVLFESELGIKLKLADGDLSILMEIENTANG